MRVRIREIGSAGGILAVLASLLICSRANAQTAPCYSYEPKVVKLTGVLKQHTFAGPPNYESIRAGDKSERYWILHLTTPICVSADSSSDSLNVGEARVDKLQLVFIHRSYSEYPNVLNRKVEVAGTLTHAITGHHHTKVLIIVQQISLSK